LLPNGNFQFGFTNQPGMGFTAFSATNLSQPSTNWTRLGFVPEVSPGVFQFSEATPANGQPRFYRVRSP
jgi:hypothetical protein